jgi:hypothetical protein
MLTATATSLRAAKPDDRGFVRPRARGAFDVVVGQPSVDRALAILAALEAEAHQAGIRLRVDRQEGQTVAIADGESVSFRMLEDPARRTHKLTAKEQAYDKNDWLHRIPEWDYFPSGILAFQITDHGTAGTRRRWGEGKRGPLEDKIPSFLDGLRQVAVAKAEHRRKREAWEREHRERERIRLETQVRENERKQFREALVRHATALHESQLIVSYVDAVEQCAADRGMSANAEFTHWRAWAQAVSAAMDPLASPPMPWETPAPPGDPAPPEGA